MKRLQFLLLFVLIIAAVAGGGIYSFYQKYLWMPGRSYPDAFISLNILNQLDILLVDFLNKKNKRITEMEIQHFRESIQQFHIDWIRKKPGCLISDTLEINQESNSKTTEQKLLHAKLPKSNRSEAWTWDFDLSKKYNPGKLTKMKVEALEW